ncbi:MutS-related protein [Granulicella rosea]|uniref:MutS-related protein n=1 Tax=Granulicella rosea TaxID=474952 RepID=UPI000B795C4E|nr:hypothetical protein [Granulicella rosea]
MNSTPDSLDSTPNSAVTAYRARQQELSLEQQNIQTKRMRLRALIWAALLLIAALYDQAAHHGAHSWPILLPVALIAGIIPYYLGIQNKLLRITRLQAFYDRGVARADGSEPQSGLTGEEFRTAGHLYDRDLNILGPDSLFGLLATVRTGIGLRGLAVYLLQPVPQTGSAARQAAVRELAPRFELRERIALLGSSRFQEVKATVFDAWLDEAPPSFPGWVRPVLVVTAMLMVGMLLASAIHTAWWPLLAPNVVAVAAVQAGVSMTVRKRVLAVLGASKVADQMQLFSDGLELLQAQAFTAPKLVELQRQAREPDAVAAIRGIQNQFVIVEQRTKEYFFVFSLLLAAGTQAAISIAEWKRQYAPAMRQWLAAWGEFEALNALATYAFEHEADIYPELLPADAAPAFEAESLGHPLLPVNACVRNDVALGDATRFYLISGSNMAGKSTLLRAVGVNAVLAYAGAPVRAARLRLTPLTLAASLALTDSLAEGKSKFLAEVERLQLTLDASQRGATLFLIDEIFSGTNSTDRRVAAAAILERLLANHAIGALSTHDLALTELATPEARGLNLHMASPDADDPLGFDYRLKPGINQSSNALAIIRMMGM